MDVGAKELRRNLSKILDRVERGERVIVHRRGRPAAELARVESPARGLPDLAGFRGRIRTTGKATSRLVLEERRKAR
jgi:prevent-host-death family protein